MECKIKITIISKIDESQNPVPDPETLRNVSDDHAHHKWSALSQTENLPNKYKHGIYNLDWRPVMKNCP